MILVTGGSGFIGAVTVSSLDGAVALRRKPDGHPAEAHTVAFDLTQTDKSGELVNMLRPLNIEHVIHTASVTPWSRDADWSQNETMAQTLVKVCNNLAIPKLTFISGWNVYDMSGDAPFDESTPLRANGEYGKSKLETEELFKRQLDSTVCVSLRVASVYGPGQVSPGLITNLMRAALAGRALEVVNGDVRRDYVYIDDVVDCLRSVRDRSFTEHTTINVGSGDSIAVVDVARTISAVYAEAFGGRQLELKIETPENRTVLQDNRLDIGLAQSLGMLRQTRPFREGISRNMEWMKQYENIL